MRFALPSALQRVASLRRIAAKWFALHRLGPGDVPNLHRPETQSLSREPSQHRRCLYKPWQDNRNDCLHGFAGVPQGDNPRPSDTLFLDTFALPHRHVAEMVRPVKTDLSGRTIMQSSQFDLYGTSACVTHGERPSRVSLSSVRHLLRSHTLPGNGSHNGVWLGYFLGNFHAYRWAAPAMCRRKALGSLLLAIVALIQPCAAQTRTRQNITEILGFENGTPGSAPAGWSGNIADAVVDDQVVHGGKYSARLERSVSNTGTFSWIFASIAMDFPAKTIEWKGFLKTENVSDSVAILLRQDSAATTVAFNTTQGQRVNGTTDWKEYSTTISSAPAASILIVGVLLSGTGKLWVDDLQLLVDGKPIADLTTVLDSDHEFDGASRISLTSLSETQVKNLTLLARVWGFVKYHHPAITAGTRHWDYDLFRVMPLVLAAPDSAQAQRAISSWVAARGPVAECTLCVALSPNDLYMPPNLDWIKDESLLGTGLSSALVSIHRNRALLNRQFYISLVPGVGNPSFDNELPYPAIRYPDAGYQLLGLFRFWNMVEYFYPNRDIISDDPATVDYWLQVLQDSIPRVALAKTSLQYQQELMRFIARINDTHANLWSSIAARPPIGTCQLPVDVRFVEGRPIVLRYNSPTAGPASNLKPGDVIEELDGVAVADLVTEWWPLYAASNDAARTRDIGWYFTRGPCGPAQLRVSRGDESIRIDSTRVAIGTLRPYPYNDLAGEAFQKLSNDVAYLKLGSVEAVRSASYVESAAGTRGLIIDIRNYPSEFVVFTLGQLLLSEPTDFARFTIGDLTNPGAFYWTSPLRLVPQKPHYDGTVVILVDETTQSQAEYTTMAFRAAPGAIVIGSTTAGADGNVSPVRLPGGFSSYISGIGVFYPDNRPTQRVGIIPDIEVRPSIEGIRAGRDELIEEAIRQITATTAPTPVR